MGPMIINLDSTMLSKHESILLKMNLLGGVLYLITTVLTKRKSAI